MLWFKFARRYMFSPKSHSVINIISSVSVIAVIIPTAAMVILLAMFDGLHGIISTLYSTVDADIELLASRGQTFDEEALNLDSLRQIEGVTEVAPYIEQSVMASSAGRRTTILLRGVDSLYLNVLPLDNLIVAGELESLANGDVVLGSSIASALGAYGLGTEIELYAMNRKQISTLLPTSGISRRKTNLGGVLSANSDIDETFAIYDLRLAQKLLNYAGRLSGIAIKVAPNSHIESVEQRLEEAVGEDFEVRTRGEKNASMDRILRMERLAIIIIGAMIALVATFSIIGSVVMLITDKRRDIATLRAMGASRKLVERIFIGEGMLLTAVGCLGGIVLGMLICLGQQHFGWVRIPGSSIVEFYPVVISLIDIITIAFTVLAIGWIISSLTVKFTLRKL